MLSRMRPWGALAFALALIALAGDPNDDDNSLIANLGAVLPLEIGAASSFELPLIAAPEEPPVTAPWQVRPPRQSRSDGQS